LVSPSSTFLNDFLDFKEDLDTLASAFEASSSAGAFGSTSSSLASPSSTSYSADCCLETKPA